MGKKRYHKRWLPSYTWNSSSKTFRGSAVKVFQHTQPPFENVFYAIKDNLKRMKKTGENDG